MTINDPTAPAVAVEASGLLAGGARSGSDPVTVTATDGAGIRRVELVDVTDPRAHGRRRRGLRRGPHRRQPDLRLQPARAVPGLSRETIRATSLPAGQRALVVRVTDTGGNIVDSGPYPVFAVTPSDRGAVNGAGATETGTLSLIWTKGAKGEPPHGRLRHARPASAAG